MAPAKSPADAFVDALRAAALRLPDVEEGIACKGTAIESRTFKVHKKAFLFVRRAQVMLKLEASADEARRLASMDERFHVGTGGWVTVKPGAAKSAPRLSLLKRWVAESYRLLAGDRKVSAKRKSAARQ
jgi:YjbR protein